MPKRLSVSVLVEVPDDPFAAADVYKQLQPSWQSLLEALKASGANVEIVGPSPYDPEGEGRHLWEGDCE